MAFMASSSGSEKSTGDTSSSTFTLAEMSPYINAQIYSLPAVDARVLPGQIDIPQSALDTTLPNITSPDSAAKFTVRHVCCVGAGYVGEFYEV